MIIVLPLFLVVVDDDEVVDVGGSKTRSDGVVVPEQSRNRFNRVAVVYTHRAIRQPLVVVMKWGGPSARIPSRLFGLAK